MKRIVGLGNPGAEYQGTRHNVGFEVVDEVAHRWGLVFRSAPANALVARAPGGLTGPGAVMLVKPLTYMNRSGFAVTALLSYYRIELSDLLVVTEDVNLPLGRLRVRRQGSAGGHNGLRSVFEQGGGAFSRLRLGVGRGDPRIVLSSRVLSRFDSKERPLLDEAMNRAVEAVQMYVDSGIEPVMNTFNRQDPRPDDKREDGTDCLD